MLLLMTMMMLLLLLFLRANDVVVSAVIPAALMLQCSAGNFLNGSIPKKADQGDGFYEMWSAIALEAQVSTCA